MSPEQLRDEIDAYDGAISYVDEAVGQLIENLYRRGLSTDTIIVLTSDHGESFGERCVYLHGNSLYLNEIHVPLIFWSPGRIPAGKRLRGPVTNAAVAATVMDLVGADREGLFPSRSLTRFWEGKGIQESPYAIAEVERINWQTKNSPSRHGEIKALLNNKWQYIEHEKWGAELYDWKIDPNATHNLVNEKHLQGVVAHLHLELCRLLEQSQSEACRHRAAPKASPR